MGNPDSAAEPRRIARAILERVFGTRGYADILLDNALRRTGLGDRDKALTTELVYGTLRWWARLDWILSRAFRGNWREVPDPVKRIAEIALYQILFLDRVPAYAAVDQAVRQTGELEGGRWKGTVNAILRTLIRNPDAAKVPEDPSDPAGSISLEWSHPRWLVEEWIGRFGKDRTARICEADNERPGISIRVNPLRSDVTAVMKELEAGGISAETNPFAGEFIAIDRAGDVGSLAGLREGRFSVQDASAGLVAHLVDPRPGEDILDMAAAPGGKTTHMAELSGDQAAIQAMDIHSGRLAQVEENAGRLGLRSIAVQAGDGRHQGGRRFDKVLVDAPCSGMGVLRKRPELKWRRIQADIETLSRVQGELLESAAASLKTRGVLVYSTCTVVEKENHGVIGKFLSRHCEFQIEDAGGFVRRELVSERGCVETWPDLHGMDGSFAVRMRKMES
jgi:16S rRNA (cytosine967-C5)-methyltransferase